MIKTPMWLFEPEDEIPSAVGFMPPVGQEPTDDGGDAPEADVPEPKGDEPTTPATTAPAVVDAAALAKQFGEVIAQHMPTTKSEPKKTLSPEEMRKALNYWEPDDGFFTKFNNMETQREAFLEMRDALLKQFDTIAQARLHEGIQTIETRLTPLQEMIQQQQSVEREKRFDTKYPQLSNPALRPLIHAVGLQLQQQGKSYKDEESMFADLAAGAEKVIQTTNPQFKLSAQATSGASRGGRIPTTSRGSSGAAAGAGGDGDGKSTPKAVSFLPKVR